MKLSAIIILLTATATIIACSNYQDETQLESNSVTQKVNLAGDDLDLSAPNVLPFAVEPAPLDDDMFVGDYLVEQVSPGIFGYDTFDPDGDGVVLTLLNNEMATGETAEPVTLTDKQRAFDAYYIAELGFANLRTYVLEFFSEKVYFPYEEYTFLTCSGKEGVYLGFPNSVPGTFEAVNDSIFTLRFLDDVYDSCSGEQLDVELLFTKL